MKREMPQSRRIGALLIALAACFVPTEAISQVPEAKIKFSIPAQPAAKALETYARQANVQILYPHDLAAGVETKELVGEYTKAEAVAKLLTGTGLHAEVVSTGVVAVRGPAARGTPANPILLAQAPTETGRAGASDRPDASRKIEQIEVTGTRIRGVTEGPSPVQVYTRQEIEASGSGTIADFVRKLPQNFNSAIPETTFFSATATNVGNPDQGFATSVNLRGMGADSTLILLNGRRLATSGGTGGAIVDISTIPLAAIERIEVLADGASAIYGADAIGGVVNIILRRHFDGAQVSGRYGNDTQTRTSGEWIANVVGGWSSEKSRVLAGIDYLDRELLSFADRSRTHSLDRREFGGRDIRSIFQATPGNVRAVDNFLNALNRPTSSTNWVAIPRGQDGTRLTPSSFDPAAPANLGPEYQSGTIWPGERRKSAFASAEYWIGDSLRLFADGLYSDRSVRFNQSAPITTGTRVPASNPFNPFGEDVFVTYGFTREFPRGVYYTRGNEAKLLTVGAGGAVPGISPRRNWSWELALTTSSDDFEGNINQFVSANATAAAALTDRARALNLFGDQGANNPETLASLFRPFLVSGKNTTDTAFFKADGSVFAVPGGDVKAAIGAEFRKEKSSSFSELVNSRFGGERDLKAVFAELLVPLAHRGGPLHRFDVTVAGRAEDYSDFGRADSPKVGIVIGTREAILRASWGKSFKAPLLREVTNSGALIDTTVSDTNAPGGPRTVIVPILNGPGNSRLKPEKADIFSVGGKLDLAPGPRTKLGFDATYFDIAFKDRIVTVSTLTVFSLERQGVLPPGVVTRDAAGNLTGISFFPLNFAKLDIAGFDASLSASHLTSFGQLSLVVSGTRFTKYESQILPGQPMLEVLGHIGWPTNWTATATLGWTLDRWSANVSVLKNASYLQDIDPVVPGKPDLIPGWTNVDLNVSYETARSKNPFGALRIGVGVSNVLDKEPPFVQGLLGYDPSRASIRGRSYFVSVSKTF